jgi:hypothetical protein
VEDYEENAPPKDIVVAAVLTSAKRAILDGFQMHIAER